ncbi:MAG: diguanylate cyclase [Comamonadaceae bacterium]|nr:diguanylate cyclase [Comamonadaceae bacterium]UJB66766.1 diguanylate cyclase [Acidovorax sp. YS12]
MPRFFNNLKLVNKVLLMVGLLGSLSVLITVFALLNMRAIDRSYRDLLAVDVQAAILIDGALLEMNEASRLVFAVLTEQEEARMRAVGRDIAAAQERFRQALDRLAPLLRGQQGALAGVRAHEAAVAAQSARIVEAAARWRGDRALQIIHEQLQPELKGLRRGMDGLRDASVANYQAVAAELAAQTRRTTVQTALAFGLAVTFVILLSAWLSIHEVSRPINGLAAAMRRLANRDYEGRIEGVHRRDEVGQIAQAMDYFREKMIEADRLQQEVLRDPLTGIANRRAFDQALELAWRQLVRSQRPLSLLFMDIDHFKAFNDHYGHGEGDRCLARIAGALHGCVHRPGDLVARYGGEEFVAILPDTDAQGALGVAQACHAATAVQAIPHGHSGVSGWVTLSIGVATMVPRQGSTPQELLQAADAMLYAAKAAGRKTTRAITLAPTATE